MAIKGTINGSTDNEQVIAKITWTAQQNDGGNYSDITASLIYQADVYASFHGLFSGEIIINGVSTSIKDYVVDFNFDNPATAIQATVRVYHRPTGEADPITISASGVIAPILSAETVVAETYVSGAVQLSKIILPVIVLATDAYIESVSSISAILQYKNYEYSIKYQLGEIEGYLSADGTSSETEVRISESSNISFLLPAAFYAAIPDARSGICTLSVMAYSVNTDSVYGPFSSSFTAMTSPEKCVPQVSGAVADTNPVSVAATGNDQVLVRYISNALCSIAAYARNDAALVAKRIDGTQIANTNGTIYGVEKGVIAFSAEDSRGYITTVNVAREMVEYIKLTANATLTRDDPTSGDATLKVTGDYFNNSFGASGSMNVLAIQFRLKQAGGDYGEYQEALPVISGNAYSVEMPLSGLDYQYAYTVELVATDAVSSVTKTTSVSRGIPIYDWGQDDFRINVGLLMASDLYGETVPTTNLKKGRIFYLGNAEEGYVPLICDGESWSPPHVEQGEPGQDGAPGVGVPEGGSAGAVLTKASDDDYDTEWKIPIVSDDLPAPARAEVGQIVRVLSVDENGKVTAVEAVTSALVEPLTMAEYNALIKAGTFNPEIVYMIVSDDP